MHDRFKSIFSFRMPLCNFWYSHIYITHLYIYIYKFPFKKNGLNYQYSKSTISPFGFVINVTLSCSSKSRLDIRFSGSKPVRKGFTFLFEFSLSFSSFWISEVLSTTLGHSQTQCLFLRDLLFKVLLFLLDLILSELFPDLSVVSEVDRRLSVTWRVLEL